MKNIRDKCDWSQYNQKLKKIARIDFFISEEAIKNWYYSGKQRRGGKLIYSSHVIEICLLMREFHERDEAIRYIKHNTNNGDPSLARKSWKEKSGYHARSLVETTMWQIKSHSSDYLSNKREDTRAVQAKIKCKIVNLVNAA